MNRGSPIALGWVRADSDNLDWEAAQICRLARHLGYRLVWPPMRSRIPLVDQVRASHAEAVIAMTPGDFDSITLQSVMRVADVETVLPRLSFARWATTCDRTEHETPLR
ncbi:MAG: hypothetical protein J2P17_31520 [Mycobacterium sp.]|nr:hypothetical protein [Mycobacterium sp.]